MSRWFVGSFWLGLGLVRPLLPLIYLWAKVFKGGLWEGILGSSHPLGSGKVGNCHCLHAPVKLSWFLHHPLWRLLPNPPGRSQERCQPQNECIESIKQGPPYMTDDHQLRPTMSLDSVWSKCSQVGLTVTTIPDGLIIWKHVRQNEEQLFQIVLFRNSSGSNGRKYRWEDSYLRNVRFITLMLTLSLGGFWGC